MDKLIQIDGEGARWVVKRAKDKKSIVVEISSEKLEFRRTQIIDALVRLVEELDAAF